MGSRGTKPSLSVSTQRLPGGVPRYRLIYEELLREIETGRYVSGERLPSEALLCDRFQVSRITIAKAIQTLQQDGLVSRRAGSGTFIEQPTCLSSSLSFGLLIPDLGTTEIFEQICQGIMRSTKASSHSLIWGNSAGPNENNEGAAERLCQQYIEQRVAGVFFAPIEYARSNDVLNRRIATRLTQAKMPVVLLDRCIEHYPLRSRFDLVGIDNHSAGFVITKHLIDTGARNIVFAALPNAASTVEARLAGYHEAIKQSPRKTAGSVVTGNFEDSTFVNSILSQEKPEGFVCANDVTAARLMQTLVHLGAKIPGEIKIAGIDDVTYAKYLPVPLTTIKQNCAEIGAAAMATMLERLANPERPPRDVLIRFELVKRESTAQ